MSTFNLEKSLSKYLELVNEEFISRKSFFYRIFLSYFSKMKINDLKKSIYINNKDFNVRLKLKYSNDSYYINFYLTSIKNTKLKLHLVSSGDKIWVIDRKNQVILFNEKKGVLPYEKIARLLINDVNNFFNL